MCLLTWPGPWGADAGLPDWVHATLSEAAPGGGQAPHLSPAASATVIFLEQASCIKLELCTRRRSGTTPFTCRASHIHCVVNGEQLAAKNRQVAPSWSCALTLNAAALLQRQWQAPLQKLEVLLAFATATRQLHSVSVMCWSCGYRTSYNRQLSCLWRIQRV